MPKSRRKSMDTTNEVFGTFMDSESQYIVPRFQRDYNWESDHVLEFWDDLYKHYKDWKDKVKRIPYYFGSFMLVNADESDPKFVVVDGQQRLTTSTIFFIALRDYFFELQQDDDVEDLNKLINFTAADGSSQPKLQLNRYNQNYFKTKLMSQDPLTKKVVNVARNVRVKDKQLLNTYQIFSKIILDENNEYFSGIPIDEKIETLRDVYEHLNENFIIVENIFSSKQRAYRIFETINHKGLGLNENDLVKNYLLELIDDTNSIEESQDVINADYQWGDIVSRLEHIKMKEDVFLRSHLTAFVGKTPKNKIYDAIVSRIDDKASAQTLLNELEHSAKFLSRIKKPEKSEWWNKSEIVDNLNGLVAISDGGMYPIFLAAEKRFDPSNMQKLIEVITKLHFRAKTVCGVSYTNIEALVVRICTHFKNSSTYSLPDVLTDILDWGSYPSDDEFNLKFKQLQLTSSPKAKYVLSELEYAMTGGRSMGGKSIDDDVTIEHILPKSIEGEWTTELDKNPTLNTPAEVSDYHKRNLHRLGNLTLLAPKPNSIIQNDLYAKKLKGFGAYDGYRDDVMVMTKRLADYPQWGEEEIGLRQESFLLHAKVIWKINK